MAFFINKRILHRAARTIILIHAGFFLGMDVMQVGCQAWKGICIGLMVLLLLSGAGNVQAERRVLRVGYTESPGFFSRDAYGRYSGYAYMYMEGLAPYGDWRMEYIPGSREENLARLAKGEIDAVPGLMKGFLYPGISLASVPLMHVPIGLHLRNGAADIQSGGDFRIGSNVSVDGDIFAVLGQAASIKGLNYQNKPYFTDEAVMGAYEKGEIDGVLGGIMAYQGIVPPVAMLETKAVYIAVREENNTLAQELDNAMKQVNMVNPRLQTELFEDNYTDHVDGPLLLTPEEHAYLQRKQKFVVLSSPGQKPYSYFENGKHKGVIAEIMKNMAADLGISFEVRETSSNEEVMQLLRNGEADLITDFYYDYNWGREHHVNVTFPYLDLNYVAIMRRNAALPEKPRIACVTGHYYTHAFVEKNYDASQLIYFDTVQQCLEAVSDGQADITFTKAITAQEDILKGNYYDLVTNGNVVFAHKVAMGVNDQLDPILYRILNKEIAHLNPVRMQGVVNKAVFDIREERNVISLLYRYPAVFFFGTVLLAVLIIGTLLYALWVRRNHLRQMRQMAYTDMATGLPNLRWLQMKLPPLLAGLAEEQQQGRVWFMLLGVGRLDILWDIYGREKIGRVLCDRVRKAASTIPWIKAAAVLPGTGRCYSLCCLPAEVAVEDREKFLLDFVEGNEVLRLGDMSIRLNMQAGIYRLDRGGKDPFIHMLSAADIAYNEIQGTAAVVGVYDESLQQGLRVRKQIEDCMEQALRDQEFQVWCQPKYDIRTHRLTGAEALVRWHSSVMGDLMPGTFIDVFEHNGFILRFDYYMLEKICQLQRQRLDDGQKIVPISVNQSRLHIKEENYLDKMQRIADRYKLPAGCVELELTETAFGDFEQSEQRGHAVHVIKELKKMGYSISMDDFGSGYSSLALLQTLPMDIMKIDRSMLVSAEESPRAKSILRNIVDLGQRLGMEVICEGIETPEQEKFLLELGCRYGQGYLYARPMPMQKFADFIENQGKTPV